MDVPAKFQWFSVGAIVHGTGVLQYIDKVVGVPVKCR